MIIDIDLQEVGLRALNARLHTPLPESMAESSEREIRILNPMGAHSVAVGLDGPFQVEVDGHVGFYCGGIRWQRFLDPVG